MIGFLSGRVHADVILVGSQATGTVGYEVHTLHPLSDGDDVSLWVSSVTREAGTTLYGFAERCQRDMFEALCRVSRVGPTGALSVLAFLGCQGVIDAKAESAPERLSGAPGIGLKTAQTICGLLSVPTVVHTCASAVATTTVLLSERRTALAALEGLGLSPVDAQSALRTAESESDVDALTADDLVRRALAAWRSPAVTV